MKKLIGPFVFAMILSVGMATLSCATADKVVPGSHTVKGDLLKIEGDFYVVQDMSGKENRLHIDKTTQLDDAMKVGDNIEAQASERNHAYSIKHVRPKM